MDQKKVWIPDFGTKGWTVTLFGVCYYFLYMSVFDTGLNTLFPAYNQAFGWSVTEMSSVVAVGGWLAIVGIAVFGAIAKRKGAKFTTLLGLAGVVVSFVIVAVAQNFVVFSIGLILYFVFAVAFGVIGVGQLGASWFPTRKGMYMGITTFGITVASATINLIMQAMIPTLGLTGFFLVFAGITAAIAALTAVLVKNTPEEAGAFPDNDKSMTTEKVMASYAEAEEYRKQSPWTLKKVLSTPQTWLIGIGLGIPMMCGVGIMTHLVEMLASFGHDPMFGVILLSTVWPVGLLAHYLIAVVDGKFGTKTAVFVVLGLMVLGALAIMLFGANSALATIGVALFLFAISGNLNVCMSMTTSVFGRHDFENAWPSVSVIYKVCQSAGVLVIALIAAAAGYVAALISVVGFLVVAAVLIASIAHKQIGGEIGISSDLAESARA